MYFLTDGRASIVIIWANIIENRIQENEDLFDRFMKQLFSLLSLAFAQRCEYFDKDVKMTNSI